MSVNFDMGQEILKFTKKSGKGQENGVDINMKPSFQIMTVNVMMWLLSLSVIDKKCKKIMKCISVTFGHFVNQAIT